jgi:phosphotransferase system enzyme I (PtsP)
MRMMLDRPTILRGQLRALLAAAAAAGQALHLMFPMVAEVAEFEAARRLLDMELRRAAAAGRPVPERVELGVMLEVPSLFWQLPALLSRVAFVSVGSNDLFQFLFACDRGNPALVDRYDALSPPALSFFADLVDRCRAAGVRLSVCGEMASRPLEAMALIGLGVRELSLAPSELGPVKAMLRSVDAARLEAYLRGLLELPDHSLRGRLQAYAQDHGVVLPTSVYRPL